MAELNKDAAIVAQSQLVQKEVRFGRIAVACSRKDATRAALQRDLCSGEACADAERLYLLVSALMGRLGCVRTWMGGDAEPSDRPGPTGRGYRRGH